MTPTRHHHQSWILALFFVLSTVSLAVGANEKGEQLRRGMAEIALLSSQLTQRKDDAVHTRKTLSAKLAEFKNETLQVLGENKIKTQAEALNHPRVYYNLLLMAEIDAYMTRYTEKIGYYRVACDRLGYLYQQADDELKIVSTLSDLKIDALIGQTRKVLDRYFPDAQTIAIDPITLTVKSPKTVLVELVWTK